ncbi:hypothetical protein CKW46_07990 [Mycobacterium liflandii]|nr:hypothetical protein CKW46_07990 [Mycobacterium liflandii]
MNHAFKREFMQRKCAEGDHCHFAAASEVDSISKAVLGASARAPALLISRLVSWVDDLWCRAIGAGV